MSFWVKDHKLYERDADAGLCCWRKNILTPAHVDLHPQNSRWHQTFSSLWGLVCTCWHNLPSAMTKSSGRLIPYPKLGHLCWSFLMMRVVAAVKSKQPMLTRHQNSDVIRLQYSNFCWAVAVAAPLEGWDHQEDHICLENLSTKPLVFPLNHRLFSPKLYLPLSGATESLEHLGRATMWWMPALFFWELEWFTCC